MKNNALISLVIAGLFLLIGQASAKSDKITMASPFSPLVMPMAYMVENGLMDDVAEKTELKIWNTPDQLRAMITTGAADFASVSTNVAAIFYNKGIGLKLVDVPIWGGLYIVSSDTEVRSLSDLKGRNIYVPFRGDLPDLTFQTIAHSQGFDLLKDFKIQYVSSPLDSTMGLLGGQIKNAVLFEPVCSTVIMKGDSRGLHFKRVLDFQKELAKIPEWQGNRFPNAAVIALPSVVQRPELVDAFAAAYDKAVRWTVAHPSQAANLAAKYVPGIDAAVFEESLKHTHFQAVHSRAARADFETMFKAFLKLNPKSVGEKLPDDGFYYP